MRKILKKTLGRGSEDQKGFTLIELLVVVGIIVALAAVIVPLVVQFAGRGDTGAQAAELDIIQAAIDTMMTDNVMLAVDPSVGAAAVITDTIDFDATAGTQTFAAYVRDSTTTYCYTWVASGKVTQAAC